MKTRIVAIIAIILVCAILLTNIGASVAAPILQEPYPDPGSETPTETPPSPEIPLSFPPDGGQEGEDNPYLDRLLENYPLVSEEFNLPLSIEGANPPMESQAGSFVPMAVSAGLSFSCAVSTSGAVKCWGDNNRGRLGDGGIINHYTPVSVAGWLSNVVKLSTWHKHTCALTSTGGMKCWGYNLHGELGNGTTTDSLLPVDVPGLTSGVKDIAIGGFHTCALLTNGLVKCWGANWHGQVGDGTTDEKHSPVDVVDLSNVQAIALGKYHSCALLNTGALKCWGFNTDGQLGNGTTSEVQASPVSVKTFTYSGAKAISLGAFHTCALTTNNGVKCWGDNYDGALGDGTREDHYAPIEVPGLTSGVASVSAGGLFTCARLTNGGAKCWGSNWAGQLGDGTTTRQLSPVSVTGLGASVNFIDTGDSHTCAVMSDNKIKCWGSNAYGQLGDGSSALRLTPVSVTGLGGSIKVIVTGSLHTCALTNAGGVQCWGNNYYGQLGDGSLVDRITPVNVSGLSSGVKAIAAGALHTCAVMTTGKVKCWGYNKYGQLGNNESGTKYPNPVDVLGITSGAVSITAGLNHTCAQMSGGGIKCWGDNRKGQLGDRTKEIRYRPVNVLGLQADAVQVVAGERHTCARTSTGGMKCWGFNYYGQLGDGTYTDRTEPVNVSTLNDGVSSITAGIQHTCAVVHGGVMCWGGNYFAQLGDGTFTVRKTPVNVAGLTSGATAVAAGGYHSCAILAGGSALCWGENWTGQLGDDTTFLRMTPVYVNGLPGALSAIAGGTYFTCGIVSGGGVCWGTNGNGQLADGTTPWAKTPSMVYGLNPAELAVNFYTGQPGSTLLFTGANFPPGKSATININGYTLPTTLPIDGNGNLSFLLTSTIYAGSGQYLVFASSILNASLRFSFNPSDPLRDSSGGSVTLALPDTLAMLQSMFIAYGPR